MSDFARELFPLERSLWNEVSRFDRGAMNALFAPDFFEIGRSGRIYARDDLLFDPSDATPIPAKLHDMRALSLGDALCQILYRSELNYPTGTEWAWRSSLWDRATGSWQLRFHQGTPTQPE